MLPPAGRTPLPKGQLAQVAALAAQVQQYARDFLSGDLVRFDAALDEWQRNRPRPPQ